MRPSRSVLWPKLAFHYCVCTIQRQPSLFRLVLNSTFSIQWCLAPLYHILRAGRFPRVHRHLDAKLISSFLISADVVPMH